MAITECIKVHSEMNILQVSKLIITKIYGMTLHLMKVGAYRFSYEITSLQFNTSYRVV